MQSKIYSQTYSLIRISREPELLLPALKQLSALGWDGVEIVGAQTCGMSVADYKKFLDELGLDVISFHSLSGVEEYETAVQLGARFADLRAVHGDDSYDDTMRQCELLNEQGKLMKASGLTGVLHNHAEEFHWVVGMEGSKRVYDLILENTDPEFVSFELDIGWACRGGVKPEDYITKYAGRFPLLHVKECNQLASNYDEMAHFPTKLMAALEAQNMGIQQLQPSANKEQQGPPPEIVQAMYESRKWNVELGNGLLNWTAIRDAAEAQGVQGYINEREYYHCYGAEGDALLCSKGDLAFLRAL